MAETAVPIRTLLVTVFESIIEVFLLCTAGYVLSRAGVTDKATQRKLNVINVSLFTPALLFSKVAFSLTPAKLKEMWIIPLGFVLVTALSAGVANVLARIFKLKKSQRAFAMCAAMFQNSNSLPIALIQSLVIEVPHLKWGDDDTKDQMLGRALTYLVLYSTLGMMLRWSWGVKLLAGADDEVEPEPTTASYSDDPAESPLGFHHSNGDGRGRDPTSPTLRSGPLQDEPNWGSVRRDGSPTPSVTWTAPGSAHSMQPPRARRSSSRVSAPPMLRGSSNTSFGARRPPTRTDSGRVFWGLPEYPKMDRIALPEEDSSAEEDEEEFPSLASPMSLRRRQSQPKSRFKTFAAKAKHKTRSALKSINAFMTVPMYAALLSIFIALIPPLQAWLSQLKPFEQAIRSAGQCSIPVTLVVLGAFFYAPSTPAPAPQLGSPDTAGSMGYFERKLRFLHKKGPSAYPGENRTVLVAVVSRMVIVPLIMLPFIALIAKYDLFPAAEDPVFILSAVLLVSSPPALTLAQITQAASGDAFERLISKTISWSYAVLTPPLTLAYVVVGLLFGRL